MSVSTSIWILIAILLVAANLPWLTESFLVFIKPADGKKKVWMRLVEWLILYFLCGLMALGLEKKMTGEIHQQDWEFYAIGFFLFVVFAFPGFIYRHEFLKHLRQMQINLKSEKDREEKNPDNRL